MNAKNLFNLEGKVAVVTGGTGHLAQYTSCLNYSYYKYKGSIGTGEKLTEKKNK